MCIGINKAAELGRANGVETKGSLCLGRGNNTKGSVDVNAINGVVKADTAGQTISYCPRLHQRESWTVSRRYLISL